jgi:hypothetical protein
MLRKALALSLLIALPAEAQTVSVMIVGGFHMSNPGHDMHNVQADDMLAPKRQAEIARVNEALLEADHGRSGMAVRSDEPAL